MLKIENLCANVSDDTGDKIILRGLNLLVNPGEVHAIMGPNGSGKSTLSHILAGRDGYNITDGSVQFGELDLLSLPPEDRAAAGVFLAFQYPIEIAGVNNTHFLKTSLNSIRKKHNLPLLDAMDFLTLIREKMQLVGMDEKFLQRAVNEGFSGGEKKRNEILQMLLLQPKLCILDETDSGLDVDAMQAVASGVNSLRNSERAFIVVTHYQRLLDYIIPDYVHIMMNGKIIKTGDASLAQQVEKKGYGWLSEANA